MQARHLAYATSAHAHTAPSAKLQLLHTATSRATAIQARHTAAKPLLSCAALLCEHASEQPQLLQPQCQDNDSSHRQGLVLTPLLTCAALLCEHAPEQVEHACRPAQLAGTQAGHQHKLLHPGSSSSLHQCNAAITIDAARGGAVQCG